MRIMIRKYGNNNFAIVGHRFIVKHKGMNDTGVIDSKCTCEYYLLIIVLNYALTIY